MEKYQLLLSEKEINQVNKLIQRAASVKEKIQIIFEQTGSLHCVLCSKHGINIDVDFYNNEDDAKVFVDYLLNDFAEIEFSKKISELNDRLTKGDQADILTGELEKIQKEKELAVVTPERESKYRPSYLLQGYSDKRTLSYPEWHILRGIVSNDYYKNEYIKGVVLYQYEKFIKSGIAELSTTEKAEGGSDNHLQFKEQYDVVLYFFYSGIYEAVHEGTKQNASAAAKIIAQLAGRPKEWNSIRPMFSHVRKYDPDSKESNKLYNLDSINRTIDLLESQKLDAEILRVIKDKIKKN